MLNDLFSNGMALLGLLVFVAVMLLAEGGYLLWRSRFSAEARRLKERLASVSRRPGESPGQPLLRQMEANDGWLQQRVERLPGADRLRAVLRQADLDWTLSGLTLRSAVAMAVAWSGASFGLRLPALLALAAVAAAGSLPIAYVYWRRGRRLARVEQQLPDALDLITRGLRAGHAFTATLKMAGDELQQPIGAELRAVNDEVTYGASMQEALMHLLDRVPLTDLRFFVLAVLIQRESGGNLGEILANLSALVRERHKLLAKVRVLSAEGRMSAWILGLMPFVLGGLLSLINPKFMMPLWTDPIGITIVQYTLAMMAVGAVLLWRIVRVRV